MSNTGMKMATALLFALTCAVIRPALPAHSSERPALASANESAAGVMTEPVPDRFAVPEEAVVIANGTLIDGTGAEPIADGMVVIEEDQILAVGPATTFGLPVNVDIIDAGGGTIMPGIINAHVHNTERAGTRHRFLKSGVTATCDLATSIMDMPQFEQEATDQNQPAARGFTTGPMITAPGGYPSSYGFSWDYQVATPNEARAAVTEILSLGADMIKIALEPWQPEEPWPTLTLEQTQAIVTAAHSRGVPVRAHIQQATMLDIALEAGVDAVEHVPLPFPEELKLKQMANDETLSLAQYPAYAAQLARLAQQDVTLVPTLSVGTCATYDLPGLESEARRKMCDFQLEIVGRFQELGGVVALGNDYGNPGVQSGLPLREMELLLAAGLSPMAIIEAGTQHAAQVCGHGDELGTLEAGKLADIIVVDGNPLVDMEAMKRIMRVIKEGQVVERPA